MMKKILMCWAIVLLFLLSGCNESQPLKLGISFGVGDAARWPKEMEYMEERARALGMQVESRFNKTDTPKTQIQDCFELIDSGIAALILIPRDARKADEILTYAKKNNVKVIFYARAVLGENIDFFVGYDIYRIGQNLGQHLSEKVYKGYLAILKGDENDFNSPMLYDGARKYLSPLIERGDLKVILDEYVHGWSKEYAKKLLTEAIKKNDYKIDAVFAHNDILAGVAYEVIQELGIKEHVTIVGMDAEVPALRRLVDGTQDATIYMDLKAMAHIAVNEAYNIVTKQKNNINSQLDNDSSYKIDAYLINGKVVTRENMDKVLIEPGYFTYDQIYGKQ